jgi:DNA-binding FadR family transcriptional regulator
MEQAADAEDLKRFIAMDVQFHLMVAECSKNRVMAKIAEIIRDLLHRLIQMVFDSLRTRIRHTMDRTITLHRNVYESIRRRDARSARKQMELHIEDVKKLILSTHNW